MRVPSCSLSRLAGEGWGEGSEVPVVRLHLRPPLQEFYLRGKTVVRREYLPSNQPTDTP